MSARMVVQGSVSHMAGDPLPRLRRATFGCLNTANIMVVRWLQVCVRFKPNQTLDTSS